MQDVLEFRRLGLALVTAVASLAVGCDRTPAELEALIQEQGLRQLEQSAAATGVGSAERIVLDAAARLGAGSAQPAPTLPGLDQLYDLSLERLAQRRGEAAANAARDGQQSIEAAAWAAIESGSQDDGQRALVDARSRRAQRAVAELGDAFAVAYVAVVGLAVDRAHVEISTGDSRRFDPRLRRMAASARNLHGDAAKALLNGDAAAALDVASHAAGLLNSFFDAVERERAPRYP
ncbi:MAG: hypothetical protein L0271_13625 [Gemmatimonadetes bacterium]|nr:hypothetical protein [Gemmatimonadota bacterium]